MDSSRNKDTCIFCGKELTGLDYINTSVRGICRECRDPRNEKSIQTKLI